EWPKRAAVHSHFASRSGFARWDPAMLAAYVRAGFDEVDGKVVLAIARDVETRIYNTMPHHFPALLRKHPPRCDVGFIAGSRSAEMRQGGFAASRALAGERWRVIEGTHLYPMERPRETAGLVLELLGTMTPVPARPRRAPV
ncbi:MAG: alpha/beta hydrolase, partial [Burkholderiaceae bacterium]